jgi:DNA-binding MarR family transcriptional regulator/DNA-binding CsgD family transcriptional regulator
MSLGWRHGGSASGGILNISANTRLVYGAMLADSSIGVRDLAKRLSLTQSQVKAALDDLADLGLVATVEGQSEPTTPRVGIGRLVESAESELRVQQQKVAELRSFLESAAAEYDGHLARESITHISRIDHVRSRLAELADGSTRECLSLNPGRTHTPEGLAAGEELNRRVLDRGVAIRAVYQSSFGTETHTLDYARRLTTSGGEIRVKPTLPMLLIIVDQEVALVPRFVDDPSQGAMEIRAPALVAALSSLFEGIWQEAEPFGTSKPLADSDFPDARTREVLGLLSRGLTDEAAAHRLGLSSRSVRRIIANAMEHLSTSSRFQVGAEAARRGWLD